MLKLQPVADMLAAWLGHVMLQGLLMPETLLPGQDT